jgi:hypothetical protein
MLVDEYRLQRELTTGVTAAREHTRWLILVELGKVPLAANVVVSTENQSYHLLHLFFYQPDAKARLKLRGSTGRRMLQCSTTIRYRGLTRA